MSASSDAAAPLGAAAHPYPELCKHKYVKHFPAGPRDNNEYILICGKCGEEEPVACALCGATPEEQPECHECPRKQQRCKRGSRRYIETNLRKELKHKRDIIAEKDKIIAQLEWQLAVARAAAGHQ